MKYVNIMTTPLMKWDYKDLILLVVVLFSNKILV